MVSFGSIVGKDQAREKLDSRYINPHFNYDEEKQNKNGKT